MPEAPAAPPAPPEPEYREVTIPAGTTISATLETAVSSDKSAVEDPVRARLRSSLRADGVTAIPAGARLSGVVTEAAASGKVKGRARVAFRFSRLTSGDESYDIATSSVAREAQSTKGKDAKKIGVGTGAGALIGAIAGGGKGAAIGAGVGAAAGTGVVMATKGDEVRLEPGTPVTVELSAPLTVRVLIKP
jgi:hypothetical protein